MWPFTCYVMQWGGGGVVVRFSEKKHYEGVRFKLLALRVGGWPGCQISREKALRNTRMEIIFI